MLNRRVRDFEVELEMRHQLKQEKLAEKTTIDRWALMPRKKRRESMD